MRTYVIVCGPRGAGKGTAVSAIMEAFPEAERIVSMTTRERRTNEVDGVNYYFVDKERYQWLSMIGNFCWSFGIGQYHYALEKRELRRVRGIGVTDVYPTGARWVRSRLEEEGDKALLIGVFAPRELRWQRIRGRQRDLSEADVTRMIEEDPVSADRSLYWDFDLLVESSTEDARLTYQPVVDAVRQFVRGE